MSDAFALSPVDAVDLLHRAWRKMERGAAPDEDVAMSLESLLSQTVYQLRNRAIVFSPQQRDAYETVLKFVKS